MLILSFFRVPLFTFQPPEGPFLLQSGCHCHSGCLTGLREAGSVRKNQRGALGGVGMLLSSPQLLASASLLSNAIPAGPTRSHANTFTYTRGGILALTRGPHGREKRAQSHWRHSGWFALLSGGMYDCTHTLPQTVALKRRKQKIYVHTWSLTHTHTRTCTRHTTHRPYSVSVMPSSCSPQSLPGGVV